jgi:hypothetical protein
VLTKSGAIVGIASRAGNGQARDPNNLASTCLGANAHAVYAELGAMKVLTTQAFKLAGAAPWLEGQPDPRLVHKDPPAGASSGSSGSSSGTSKASAPTAPAPSASASAPPSGDAGADGSSGGCSASGAPVRGAVENALGIVTALLLVLRWRGAKRRNEAARSEARARSTVRRDRKHAVAREAEREVERIPYVDLGMRESVASMHDER